LVKVNFVLKLLLLVFLDGLQVGLFDKALTRYEIFLYCHLDPVRLRSG